MTRGGEDGLADEERQLVLRTYSPYFRKGDLLLEVHYDTLGLQVPLVSGEDLWDGVRAVEIGGFSIPVLAPEYEICHLCLHVMQHSYGRLLWLTDIAEFVSRPGLDWGKVHSVCRREGIGAPVYYGLFLADRLWPGAVAPDVLSGLKPGFLQRILLKLFWPEDKVRSRRLPLFFPFFMPTFFALIGRKDAGLFIRTIFRILFPPRAWVAHYYAIKPGSLRIVGHYIWRIQRPFVLIARRLLRLG
ncbi:MAG: nucleotidyltransferase family protein [Candidatus Aminicenantes bacterium]|nr:nucleotidyltransferase family protein [Candidatus Aminicenantes bacterium]